MRTAGKIEGSESSPGAERHGEGLCGSSALLALTLHFLPVAYAAYFLAACILNFQRALALFVLTCLVIFVLACHFLKKNFGEKLMSCLKPLHNSRLKLWAKW